MESEMELLCKFLNKHFAEEFEEIVEENDLDRIELDVFSLEMTGEEGFSLWFYYSEDIDVNEIDDLGVVRKIEEILRVIYENVKVVREEVECDGWVRFDYYIGH